MKNRKNTFFKQMRLPSVWRHSRRLDIYTMNEISSKLLLRFKKVKSRKIYSIKEMQSAKSLQTELSDFVHKINLDTNYHPIHRSYIIVERILTTFAEETAVFPEFDEWYEMINFAQEEYIPAGPPMSPLTKSFFNLWADFDFTFGKNKETVGTCFLDLANTLGADEEIIEVVKCYNQSRMGIYRHVGKDKNHVFLKEFLTGNEYKCICPAGYLGKKNEFWFVRILPDFTEKSDLNVILTTPYILIGSSEKEWHRFFDRNGITISDIDLENKIREFLKYGPDTYYWHEYIFLGYVGIDQKYSHIKLTGIPDKKETLPHS